MADMNTVSAPMNSAPVAPVKYAGFWIRYVALIVDSLILFIPNVIIQFIFAFILVSAGFASTSITTRIISELVNLLVFWIYFVAMTYGAGATLGKMMVGITVKSDTLQKLSLGRIVIRETIGKLISGIILFIGYIIAAFTQKKQALHDTFAHSVVIYKDPSKPHTAGLVIGIIIAAILPIIAIIAILSSIVLASLSDARQNAQGAQVREIISEMRSEAEIYYSNNNLSYSHAKDCSSGIFLDPTIQQLMSSVPSANFVCYAEGSSYSISAKLNMSPSYCADSAGHAESGMAVDNNSQASCEADASSASAPSYGEYGTVPTN
jgi:uncharacterized RDD family membrane protein YckC/Tfp pilus assembly protein PilE